MSRTIFPYDTCTIKNKPDRQSLKSDIVNYLIERSLKEGRIDRDERFILDRAGTLPWPILPRKLQRGAH